MSKKFITYNEAATKLGKSEISGMAGKWATKSQLTMLGADTTKLTGYGTSQYVLDDDVVKEQETITGDKLVGNIKFATDGAGSGYYSSRAGSWSLISNGTKADNLQALKAEGSYKQVTINAHIRNLAPDTYNRIHFQFENSGVINNFGPYELKYSSSDFNACNKKPGSDEYDVDFHDFFMNNKGVLYKMTITLFKA